MSISERSKDDRWRAIGVNTDHRVGMCSRASLPWNLLSLVEIRWRILENLDEKERRKQWDQHRPRTSQSSTYQLCHYYRYQKLGRSHWPRAQFSPCRTYSDLGSISACLSLSFFRWDIESRTLRKDDGVRRCWRTWRNDFSSRLWWMLSADVETRSKEKDDCLSDRYIVSKSCGSRWLSHHFTRIDMNVKEHDKVDKFHLAFSELHHQ